jgi:hypothetical protein
LLEFSSKFRAIRRVSDADRARGRSWPDQSLGAAAYFSMIDFRLARCINCNSRARLMSTFVFSRFARYFDAVARLGSIRRAAEQLAVSPSAIDRQLSHAEDELGARLFERLPRGLRLTASGEM